MPKTYSRKLSNGLKTIYVNDQANPLFTAQLYIRCGSNWEQPEQSGYCHLLEHLVFKSTVAYPGGAIMQAASYLGGVLNAYTEYDSTCFYITLPAKYQRQALHMLSELARWANWSENDFKSELGVVLEEVKQYDNDPEDSFVEEIPRHYFKHNPYRNPILGSTESLNAATSQKLHSFYQRTYNPNNAYLVVGGKLQGNVSSIIRQYFGPWQGQPLNYPAPASEPYPKEAKYIHIKRSIRNDMLSFVLPEAAERDPITHILGLITRSFCVGKNSRLYKRLYNRDKLIDHLRVHSMCGLHNGITIVEIIPKKRTDIPVIADVFWQELERLRRFGLSADEVVSQKNELAHSWRWSAEHIENLAMSLGGEELLDNWQNYNNYLQTIKNINTRNVQDAIDTWYKPAYVWAFTMGKTAFEQEQMLPTAFSNNRPASVPRFSDYWETDLDSGIKLLYRRIPGRTTCGISLVNPVSHLCEQPLQRGANSLTSALLLYGNAKRKREEFVDYCTSHGVSATSSTLSEATSLRFKCFTEQLPLTLQMLYDTAFTPTLPPEYFTNLRKGFISNYSRIKDYPQYWAGRLFKELMFGAASNLLAKEGSKAELTALKINTVRQWYKQWWQAPNLTLAVAGDIDQNRLIDLCQDTFTPLGNPAKTNLPQALPVYTHKPGVIDIKDIGSDQSVIHVGGMAPGGANSAERTAFTLLTQVIGGEINSRLFDELREKRGWAYSCGMEYSSLRQMGWWYVWAIVDKNKQDESIEIIYQLLAQVVKKGITRLELETARNYLRGQRLLDDESVLSQAHTLALLDSLGLGWQHYLEREKRLQAVSRGTVHQLARTWLKQSEYVTHVLG